MIVNLPQVRAIHNHFANMWRESIAGSVAECRANIAAEQAKGSGLRKRTGALFDATKTEARWTGRGVHIGVTNDKSYAAPLEFGSKPYTIYPKSVGGRLSFFWTKVGKWVSLRKVRHPGNRTYSFLKRAVDVSYQRLGYSLLYAADAIASRF